MDDYYCVEEVSDQEVIDSSSDDEDFKSLFTFNESSNEDFESEMERERLNHVNGIHNVVSLPNITPNVEESENKSSDKNDEIFYDPESDESDQKWVNQQRLVANNSLNNGSNSGANSGANSGGNSGANSSVQLGSSDATLNCPACMSLLCLDCQRHVIYKTQYRAMFVFNCKIDFTQKLQYKDKNTKRHKKQFNCDNHSSDDYYAVLCDVCNTQVAVYDKHEVYHFFSVLASF